MGYPSSALRSCETDDERQAAFERSVVISETRRLYRLALVIVVDPHEAADAVQETLLSAWRHWGALRDPGAQAAWLIRICVRRCLRHRHLLNRRVLWSSARWEEAPAPPAVELDGRLLDVYTARSPPCRRRQPPAASWRSTICRMPPWR